MTRTKVPAASVLLEVCTLGLRNIQATSNFESMAAKYFRSDCANTSKDIASQAILLSGWQSPCRQCELWHEIT